MVTETDVATTTQQSSGAQGITWRRCLGGLVAFSAWAYLLAVVILSMVIWRLGDVWWVATAIQYGPRWVWALPLAVLLPASAIFRRRSAVVLLASLVVVVGPVMGFQVPWSRLAAPRAAGGSIRVLSLNMGGGLDRAALASLLAEYPRDVIAIQEAGNDLRLQELVGPDWHVRTDVVRMAFASRFPILDQKNLSAAAFGHFGPVAVRYQLETPSGNVQFLNLHPLTPRSGLEDVLAVGWEGADSLDANTETRRRQSEAAAALLDQVEVPVLIAGDFNLPIESAIYRRYWSRYTNAFSTVGLGFGYTYGRTRRFQKWVRIDHVLADPDWRALRCWVGPNVGSDHWPVLAEFQRAALHVRDNH